MAEPETRTHLRCLALRLPGSRVRHS